MPFSNQIDSLLNTLTAGTAEEVETALDTYTMRDIVGVLAQRLLDVEAGGGGGGSVANYAVIEIDGGPGVGLSPSLSVANPSFNYPASALSILEQSGSDFSIGEYGGYGAVFSAAGGLMQAGMIVDPQYAVATIDGGSTDPRWVQLGFNVGATASSVGNSLGYDCSFQVGGGAAGHVTFAGLPGVVMPGDPAVRLIRFFSQNPFGTDSVVCDFWDAEAMIVWTIAPLA